MTLMLLIAGYQAGLADYNNNAPTDDNCDAYADVSYVPPMDALRAFDGPAANPAEAMLALEVALKEIDDGDHETATVLVRAAHLYLREVCVG